MLEYNAGEEWYLHTYHSPISVTSKQSLMFNTAMEGMKSANSCTMAFVTWVPVRFLWALRSTLLLIAPPSSRKAVIRDGNSLQHNDNQPHTRGWAMSAHGAFPSVAFP